MGGGGEVIEIDDWDSGTERVDVADLGVVDVESGVDDSVPLSAWRKKGNTPIRGFGVGISSPQKVIEIDDESSDDMAMPNVSRSTVIQNRKDFTVRRNATPECIEIDDDSADGAALQAGSSIASSHRPVVPSASANINKPTHHITLPSLPECIEIDDDASDELLLVLDPPPNPSPTRHADPEPNNTPTFFDPPANQDFSFFDNPCPFEYEYEDNRQRKRDVPYRFPAGSSSGASGTTTVPGRKRKEKGSDGGGSSSGVAAPSLGGAGSSKSATQGGTGAKKGKAAAGMPIYKGMNVTELRKIGKKYGLRPGCKAMLVTELTKIWMVLNGVDDTPASSSSSRPAVAQKDSQVLDVPDSCGESSEDEEGSDELGVFDDDLLDDGNGVGTQMVVEDAESMEEKLFGFVKGQTSLYGRILRYEPIDFELLHQQVVQVQGLEKCSRKVLGAFLDKRAVNYVLPTKPGTHKRRRYR
ncbi:hypothetical protein HDV00_002873 [Rhizophlyctis rosea]|nr:hypothetical protein HDV00_002873 [Rhizophlyctis rosea]